MRPFHCSASNWIICGSQYQPTSYSCCCLSQSLFVCLIHADSSPDMNLCTSPSPPTNPERHSCFRPTAVLPGNLLIFAACMQEVSGAVTLQQVPEGHKTHTQTHNSTTRSNTHSTIGTYTHTETTQKCKGPGRVSVIPALLFCSSRFNWGI